MNGEQSYGEVLKEVATSTKNLLQSEIALVTAEMKESAERASTHVTQAVIFGALLAISVFPFLAFLVIGLGELMGDRYWLSSLLVALVCAGVGGFMAYRAFVKIKNYDFDFSRTKNTLGRETARVQEKVEEVKNAVKGDRYGQGQNRQQFT